MAITHYRSSKGLVEIEKMNDYHLHYAIKKERELDPDVLEALKAEQTRRGGPPSDAK